MKSQNQSQCADSNSQTTLNLKNYLALYEGLEISEKCPTTSTEETTETILIAEWVRPEWSAKPLWKQDYPQMGFVSYSEAPPP